jgi:hypothetical protein
MSVINSPFYKILTDCLYHRYTYDLEMSIDFNDPAMWELVSWNEMFPPMELWRREALNLFGINLIYYIGNGELLDNYTGESPYDLSIDLSEVFNEETYTIYSAYETEQTLYEAFQIFEGIRQDFYLAESLVFLITPYSRSDHFSLVQYCVNNSPIYYTGMHWEELLVNYTGQRSPLLENIVAGNDLSQLGNWPGRCAVTVKTLIPSHDFWMLSEYIDTI